MNGYIKGKIFSLWRHLVLFLVLLVSTSCEELFEDTDLNPTYFIECKIEGQTFRAQTNNNAWLSWYSSPLKGELSVSGTINSEDKIFNFNSFASLGASKVPVGTNVNSYLTDINYFLGDKDYAALETGGDGYVDFHILTATDAEGTFEAILVNRDDLTDILEITDGKFKVKTR